MIRDPFDHLEAQLRSAVAKRRRRRWLRPGAVVPVVLVLTGGSVALAGGVFSSGGPSPAARAVAFATDATRKLPVCAPRWRTGAASRLVAGAVDLRIRQRFAVWRRPARPGDLQSLNRAPNPYLVDMAGRDVLREGVRVTRAKSGRRYMLILSFGPDRRQSSDPVGCLEAVRQAAHARPQGRDPAVRARIDEIIDARVARVQDLLSGRSKLLTVMALPDRRLGFGAGGVGLVRPGGLPQYSGISVGGVPNKVRVDGLVPDDVHDIQVLDRDGSPRARSVVIPVAGNVYDAIVPRHMGPRMTLRWRARDGRIIRRVHIHF